MIKRTKDVKKNTDSLEEDELIIFFFADAWGYSPLNHVFGRRVHSSEDETASV